VLVIGLVVLAYVLSYRIQNILQIFEMQCINDLCTEHSDMDDMPASRVCVKYKFHYFYILSQVVGESRRKVLSSKKSLRLVGNMFQQKKFVRRARSSINAGLQ